MQNKKRKYSEMSTDIGGSHSYAGGVISTRDGGGSPEYTVHKRKDRRRY